MSEDIVKCHICGRDAKFKQVLGNMHMKFVEYVCEVGHETVKREVV